MYKFYCLEDMTQEDLNNLALERNTLQQKNQQLKEVIEEVKKIVEKTKYGWPFNEFVSKEDLWKILDKVK